jgi:hypothetical protein
MGIRDLLFGEESASFLIPSEFDVKLERTKSNKEKLEFDARVKGHFVARGGKPVFVPEIVHINGMPEMNLCDMLTRDLPHVKRYALSVEYPKALAKKLAPRKAAEVEEEDTEGRDGPNS